MPNDKEPNDRHDRDHDVRELYNEGRRQYRAAGPSRLTSGAGGTSSDDDCAAANSSGTSTSDHLSAKTAQLVGGNANYHGPDQASDCHQRAQHSREGRRVQRSQRQDMGPSSGASSMLRRRPRRHRRRKAESAAAAASTTSTSTTATATTTTKLVQVNKASGQLARQQSRSSRAGENVGYGDRGSSGSPTPSQERLGPSPDQNNNHNNRSGKIRASRGRSLSSEVIDDLIESFDRGLSSTTSSSLNRDADRETDNDAQPPSSQPHEKSDILVHQCNAIESAAELERRELQTIEANQPRGIAESPGGDRRGLVGKQQFSYKLEPLPRAIDKLLSSSRTGAEASTEATDEWPTQRSPRDSTLVRRVRTRPAQPSEEEEQQQQQHDPTMPEATTSKYKTLSGPSPSRKSSSSSRSSSKSRETFRINTRNGYTRLGYSYYQQPPKSTFWSELKRLLLLLVIVGICAVVLWQIYEALIEEDNFLGVVRYSPSILGKFNHYAVSTDAEPCARIGKNLLAKGGHAVDAAIGTLLCMGVVLPNSLGLGGGCLMTIYDNVTKTATVVDGRETAPDYASETMFSANPLSASRGPLSLGVPGELAAYWEAHQRFGRLNWSQLFDESISMAENGFQTVEHLSFALRDMTHSKHISPPLAKLLTSNATGEYYVEGETMYQRELGQTLRRIRDHGVAEFYNGTTGQLFIADLQAQGGKMTLENLNAYRALVKEALRFDLNDDLKVYTQPMPGSGVVLGIILRIMKELGYYENPKPKQDPEAASLFYHHLAEAFKFAYAQRAALESDPDDPARLEALLANITSAEFIKQAAARITDDKTQPSSYYGGLKYFQEDHGTAHTSVVDNEGNSVAVTTSVNLYFGSGLVSPSTGIIYNDVMDDFTSPNITNKFGLAPSRYNRIRPGKRPLSSMAPSVFVDGKNNPRLILGASGGSKITTAIALVALRNLFFGDDLKVAIDGPRIHHQFLPDELQFEANFPPEILSSLANRGHKLKQIMGRSSVVMALGCEYHNSTSKSLTANSDYRKGGTVDGV